MDKSPEPLREKLPNINAGSKSPQAATGRLSSKLKTIELSTKFMNNENLLFEKIKLFNLAQIYKENDEWKEMTSGKSAGI